MHAVIKTGGKQYRVTIGDILKVETLPEDAGSTVKFQVLMISNETKITLGTPFVENAEVSATILEHGRHKKIKIIKFRRRKHHMKQMGHRKNYTQIQITAIN